MTELHLLFIIQSVVVIGVEVCDYAAAVMFSQMIHPILPVKYQQLLSEV